MLRMCPEHFESDQKQLNNFLQDITFVKSTEHFVESDTESSHWVILLHYECPVVKHAEVKTAKSKVKTVEESDLTPGAQYVLECLKAWRNNKAKELKAPKYMVCNNSELINIAFYQPSSIEALQCIKGFGEKKVQRFGKDIIALLNAV